MVELSAEVLQGIIGAARFSSVQLDRICQSVFGVALSQISNASTPSEQAKDMAIYAQQYQLTGELAAAILISGADRPALQNLLLSGDKNMTDHNDSQSGGGYNMLRLEGKVDRLGERLDVIERRLSIVEVIPIARSNVAPSSFDRVLVLLVTVLMISMLVYNVLGIKIP